jgi:formate-dependent phosphoribosylglycinamide formyltransferase (GAR transformylase)
LHAGAAEGPGTAISDHQTADADARTGAWQIEEESERRLRQHRHVARTPQGDTGGRDVLGLAKLEARTDQVANCEHSRDAAVVAAIPVSTSTLEQHVQMLRRQS